MIKIRKCTQDDIPSIIKIESLSFKYPYPSIVFYNYIGKNFYVGELNDRVVGYAIGDAKRHLIVSIAVHPDYAILQVRMSNKEAIKFYKNLGFVEKELLKRYYIDGEDAILMFKSLD